MRELGDESFSWVPPTQGVAGTQVTAIEAVAVSTSCVSAGESISLYRLKDLPRKKANVVKALVYVSVLTLTVCRTLLKEVLEARSIPPDDIPRERWATIFCAFTHELFSMMIRPAKETAKTAGLLAQMILNEAIGPNRKRKELILSVETGTHKLTQECDDC